MHATLPAPIMADLALRVALSRMAEDARTRDDASIAAILEAAVRTIDMRIGDAERSAALDQPFAIQTTPITRNVHVNGKRTTVKLEKEFWGALGNITQATGTTIDALCTYVEQISDHRNLASALRVYVLTHVLANGEPK